MKQQILVVERDAACRDSLRRCLQASDFDVSVLYEPAKVMRRLAEERPALIVMASGQPLGSGLAALNALRDGGDDLPVIMLGEQDDVTERIVALECGADDFICKPFNVHEALARIRRVLARTGATFLQDPVVRPPFRFHGFELDFQLRTLWFQGEAVRLSQSEYATLRLLTAAPGQVMQREVIAQRVWPDAPHRHMAVSVVIHRLRRLIECRVSSPKLIQTVRAKGYVFLPERPDFAPGYERVVLAGRHYVGANCPPEACEPTSGPGLGY